MSGHSKWASIKHKKAAIDAKRGQLFTKLIKELTAAARSGGGNMETNIRLRTAVAKAKEGNMPWDNIEKAIMRGTGELPGVTYEEVTYEGYGPAGIAIMIDAVTDNKNRTTAELRNMMSKKGGNMAQAGAVNFLFQKKGFLTVDKKAIGEDKLMDIVLNAGAEDMKSEADVYEITTQPHDLESVKNALTAAKIPFENAELTMIPTSTIKITEKNTANTILSLMDALEEHEDVQHVYANFDIPDELIESTGE
ncbi:MAG: YebC/PmpR family DNA-binding transcriptional regulator [Candidatus Omnitrophota bacterium]|jgi:YebC/PmpR family DNA-binding regulatory protein|nr:YebC/PmpR family DNA-binding transcriptional regulator [Candidatus Omnitrophota bacterium]MDD5137563.1 YebC/PmpR family DNA-binding transcriptional regulator [Candidatus Omnitrophota bacterium]MDD5538089.1 YebC/PmpR family DNA-binding transcriptional regulator [Candidatus Omnitrophota bacterium]